MQVPCKFVAAQIDVGLVGEPPLSVAITADGVWLLELAMRLAHCPFFFAAAARAQRVLG
jgi:hypothetical protein